MHLKVPNGKGKQARGGERESAPQGRCEYLRASAQICGFQLPDSRNETEAAAHKCGFIRLCVLCDLCGFLG